MWKIAEQYSLIQLNPILLLHSTLTGLGYEVAFDHNSDQEVSYQALDPTVYRQTNGYIPRPIDLASVSLPKSVLPFIERMAENIHNIWAVDRIQEGWTYGISENSTLKQNPALVPYQNLSEKLKESNRCVLLIVCVHALLNPRILAFSDGRYVILTLLCTSTTRNQQ